MTRHRRPTFCEWSGAAVAEPCAETTLRSPRRLARPAARAFGIVASLPLLLACSEPEKRDAGSVPEQDLHPVGRAGSDSGVGDRDASTSPPRRSNPCDQDARDAAPMDSLFEPAWLPNVPLDSVTGVLTLYASTLEDGPNGLTLYAGVCNDGEFPLCSAAIQVEFYDHAEQFLGTASSAVQSGRLYTFSQSPSPISCVAPGQAAMAAVTSVPEELLRDDLKFIGHRFPAFQIDDAVPLPGLTVSEVHAVDATEGAAFRGTVTNVSDTPIGEAAVSVFPVNDVGRPLAVAVSTASLEIPPGGTWSFETNVVAQRGVNQLAFASGILVKSP